MKMYIRIFLLTLLICVVSCSDNNDVVVEKISLSGHTIKIAPSNSTKYPRLITGNIIFSNQLWGKNEYYAGILNNGEWEKSESLFKIGHGHNEFEWLRFAKGYDNSILLLDGINMLKSLTVIPNRNSIDSIKESSQWKKYDLIGLESFTSTSKNFYPMSDSTILIVGTPYKTPGHIMSIVDYKNQTCVPLDYWPDDGIKIDSLPKYSVYADYSLTFGNGKGHYLYVCGRERYAFVFSIEGNKVNVVKNLYTTYSDYRTKDHYNYISYRVRTEGLACDTNNEYIYLLLTNTDRNGHTIDIDDWKNQRLYGNIIEMYDWNGNLKKKLVLDHLGQRIVLSDDSSILYLFSDDYFEGETNPEIWVYNLTDI